MRTTLALATTSWGLLMSLAPLLQIRIVLRRRSSDGVSIGWIAVLLVGVLLWLGYGLVTSDPPLIITNSVSSAVNSATLTVVLIYRQRQTESHQRTGTR